jgi:hypothetical protein
VPDRHCHECLRPCHTPDEDASHWFGRRARSSEGERGQEDGGDEEWFAHRSCFFPAAVHHWIVVGISGIASFSLTTVATLPSVTSTVAASGFSTGACWTAIVVEREGVKATTFPRWAPPRSRIQPPR